MFFIVVLILFFLVLCLYIYHDLPKNYIYISVIITFLIIGGFFRFCKDSPKIPSSLNLLKKTSKIDQILDSYDTDMKLSLPDAGYSQSLLKGDSNFVIPTVVSEELGIEDRHIDKFNLNKIFYIEINKNRKNKEKEPHGTIWGVYNGKSDPLIKLRQSHNSFISNYYWNYILLIPILFSLFHKRKGYIIKNILAILLLVSVELMRLYYFIY